MVDQRRRSLILLARVAAVFNGLIAMVIFIAAGTSPMALAASGVPAWIGAIGGAAVLYYLTLHQLIARTRLAESALVLTFMTSASFLAVIATTGGLDSPYYSLWLLAIVAAGIFGRRETLIIMGGTLAFFAVAITLEGFQERYLIDHIVQFGITVAAAGLAEWVFERSRKATAARYKLDTLSGQLTAEQLKAQTLMAAIGEGVMVIDAAGHIQLFNRTAQELTGWDEGSAEGIDYGLVLQLRTAADVAPTEAENPFVKAWQSGKQEWCDNLEVLSRAGTKVAINLSVSPLFDAAGGPAGAIALFRDITHLKALERQKDEFVSTASHEMRTPVAAIEGYISLAMNPNVATVDERAMKYLGKAHESIQHLGELFRDLLSVTKAEDATLNLKIEPVNVSELLQGVVDDMQFAANKKGLSLTYRVGAAGGKAIAPLFYVNANPERLREVAMNLIDNSIKFTSQGGVTLSIDGDQKEIRLDVTDTGVGISDEDAKHLFQKFYRIDSSATRTIGGTGLGLYLCRTVIELFGGTIGVTGRPGQGSTFHITLPRMDSEEARRQIIATGRVLPTTDPVAISSAPQPAMAAVPMRPVAMPVPGERSMSDVRPGRRLH